MTYQDLRQDNAVLCDVIERLKNRLAQVEVELRGVQMENARLTQEHNRLIIMHGVGVDDRPHGIR